MAENCHGACLSRRFPVQDYHRMAQAGILTEDDRVELIDGEIGTLERVFRRSG